MKIKNKKILFPVLLFSIMPMIACNEQAEDYHIGIDSLKSTTDGKQFLS